MIDIDKLSVVFVHANMLQIIQFANMYRNIFNSNYDSAMTTANTVLRYGNTSEGF